MLTYHMCSQYSSAASLDEWSLCECKTSTIPLPNHRSRDTSLTPQIGVRIEWPQHASIPSISTTAIMMGQYQSQPQLPPAALSLVIGSPKINGSFLFSHVLSGYMAGDLKQYGQVSLSPSFSPFSTLQRRKLVACGIFMTHRASLHYCCHPFCVMQDV